MASTNITQQHIESCSAHANPSWKTTALATTMRLAMQRPEFTSYDVLEELAKSNVSTYDLRAIGGIMQQARDLDLIESAGLVRRNNKHTRGATTLWKSRLVCGPTEASTQ